MRRALIIGTLLVVSLLGTGCGDDDDGASEPTSTAGAADRITTTAAPAEVEDPGADADGDCASLAAAAAPALALEKFPDNPDVEWTVVDATLDEEGRAVVEVEPVPDEVGYPAFRMVSVCEEDSDPVLLGTYALEDGTWILLFTTDEPGAADLALELS